MEDFGNIPAGAGPGMDQQGGGQVPPEFEILQAIMEGGQVDDGNGNTLDFSIIPEEVRVGIQQVVMGSDGQEGGQPDMGEMPGQSQPIMPGMQQGGPPQSMMGGQGGGLPPNIPPELLQMLLSQQGGMR